MRFLVLSIALVMLVGCGLKGDLYRPAPKPTAEPATAQPQPEGPGPEDDSKDKDEARTAPGPE